mmetsp:Transcript_128047/g.410321  ORF Transcript_128047/g.410321 Transcript_128047/m.410321 type:complete len:224 (+) Transcript_128047:1251-1922(+)
MSSARRESTRNLYMQSSNSAACVSSGTAAGCSSSARPSARAAAAASAAGPPRKAPRSRGSEAATRGAMAWAVGPSCTALKASRAARRRALSGELKPSSAKATTGATQASATTRATDSRQAYAASTSRSPASSPSGAEQPSLRTFSRLGRRAGSALLVTSRQPPAGAPAPRPPDGAPRSNSSSCSESSDQTSTACAATAALPEAPAMASRQTCASASNTGVKCS